MAKDNSKKTGKMGIHNHWKSEEKSTKPTGDKMPPEVINELKKKLGLPTGNNK